MARLKAIDEVKVGIFYSPEGAVAAEGIDEITRETTQDEVINILGPRYQRIHNPTLDDLQPIADAFLYKEDAVTKYIDIWYVSGRVAVVRYGYERLFGIE